MSAFSRRLVLEAIRRNRPDASPTEIRRELFLRYYGTAFGPEERDRILRRLGREG